MKRVHEPGRLDAQAFAADSAELGRADPVRAFRRLADVTPDDAPDECVRWSAQGALRRPDAPDPEVWLHLRVQAQVWLTCQRCLEPVPVAVDVDRRFRFVRGEDSASRLDAESEDDVLDQQQALDLPALVEDELLLALPLVPRHERCPQPLVAPDENLEPARSPFAALAGLKRRS